MNELERIQTCLSCDLMACVEDLPLLRDQCKIVQIEGRLQSTHPDHLKAPRTEAEKVRQDRYNASVKGKAARARYELTFKAQVRRAKRRLG